MWTIYTVDLADSLLGPTELDAIRKHLGEDRRAEILRKSVGAVRSYCGARGRALGVAGSVPEECEQALASLYRYGLLAGLPVTNLLTEARREERAEAISFLKDVGAGRAAISLPDPVTAGPDDLTGTGPVSPSICAPPRRMDRTGLDGS